MRQSDPPALVGLSEGLGPNATLVERLRQERRATAHARGLDTDYPTAWEPNLLCHEAATEIGELREQLACVRQALPEAWRGSVPSVAVATLTAEAAYTQQRLDALGVAIADAGYAWTPAMRAAYEGA